MGFEYLREERGIQHTQYNPHLGPWDANRRRLIFGSNSVFQAGSVEPRGRKGADPRMHPVLHLSIREGGGRNGLQCAVKPGSAGFKQRMKKPIQGLLHPGGSTWVSNSRGATPLPLIRSKRVTSNANSKARGLTTVGGSCLGSPAITTHCSGKSDRSYRGYRGSLR